MRDARRGEVKVRTRTHKIHNLSHYALVAFSSRRLRWNRRPPMMYEVEAENEKKKNQILSKVSFVWDVIIKWHIFRFDSLRPGRSRWKIHFGPECDKLGVFDPVWALWAVMSLTLNQARIPKNRNRKKSRVNLRGFWRNLANEYERMINDCRRVFWVFAERLVESFSL